MKKVIIGGSIMIVTIFLVVTYTLFSYFGITQAKIAKLDITITTESLEKYYDETPLTSDVWEMSSGTLFEGDTIQVVMDSTITDAGSILNQAHVTILDEKNRAVTNNYNITYNLGSLTIKPIELTIVTVSASKTYDAEALSQEGFELYRGHLFENHRMITVMESTITDAGQIPNDIGVTILNTANNNVTHNYDITYDLGYLTVYPKQIAIRTGDASKVYDGLPLYNNTWQLIGGTLVENHELSIGMPAVIVEAGQIVNQPVITIIDNNQNDVAKNYEIIEEYGLLTIYSRNLTIKTSSLEKEYDGTVLKGGNWVITSGSLAYNHTIEANMPISIVNAGFAYNEVSIVIKDNRNNVVTHNYDIAYDLGSLLIIPKYILINIESAEKHFDGLPLINREWSILRGTLLPKHTISVDMNASITYPGSIINSGTIYIYDANGMNMNNNYYIDEGFGYLTIHPIELTIRTESDVKPYDGLPLSNDSWSILSGSLLPNHRINQTMNTSIVTPGSVENSIDLVIVDENNNDVTGIYQIYYDLGILTIYPVPLTITTETKTRKYDGTPLMSDIWMISSGALLENHRIETFMNSIITYPGTIENKITVNILDEEGRSVLGLYEINHNLGDLTILPVDIIISTETKFKDYDGLPLTSNVWNLTGGTLFYGHHISVTMNTSITEPGYVENRIDARVLDQNNNDVTHFYNINTNLGNLVVLPRNITIKTESMSQDYTGNPLTYPYFDIIVGSLMEGHYIVESMPASIMLPGEITNDIYVTIYDSNNHDVTSYYNFHYTLGTLEVFPIPLVLKAGSANKLYDGTPLEYDYYEILSGDLLPGHNLVVSIEGSITEVGSIENLIHAYAVDSDNNYVSRYYLFDYAVGKLTVLENMYDSSELARDPLEPDKTPHLNIYSTKTETIYLRQESKGDYLFYGWGTPVVQDLGITVNPLSFTSMALSSFITTNSVQIEHVRERIKHVTPYYIDDVINHTNDVYLNGDISVIYQHNYLSYDFFSDYGSSLTPNPSLSTQEHLYRNFVYDNYLAVPESTRQSMLQIANNKGLYSSSSTIIKDVKDYIQNAATYGDIHVPDDITDIAVYFLTTAKQGICQHFATAATLMYRSLGVPARYVEGYSANAKANSWVVVTGERAHAWVEVYIDGIGWIPVEVTASVDQEFLGEITVTPTKVVEMYEAGKTIVARDVKLTNFTEFKALGYTYTFILSGSQSYPGSSVSEVTQFNIFDPNGNDVTIQFDITYKTGILQLYLREITLMTYGATKSYDGTPLIKHDYALVGELEPNHYVSKVTYLGSQIVVGVSANIALINISDELGNDVTDYYLIKSAYGNLTVRPRSITIESNSATKSFDGTELTDDSYSITNGSLLDGDAVMIVITGSQQLIGRSDNIIESVRIMRGTSDVSAYYEIDLIEGLLTVTPY